MTALPIIFAEKPKRYKESTDSEKTVGRFFYVGFLCFVFDGDIPKARLYIL